MKTDKPKSKLGLKHLCFVLAFLIIVALPGWGYALYTLSATELAFITPDSPPPQADEPPPPFVVQPTPAPAFVVQPTPEPTLPPFVIAPTPTPYIPPRVLFAGDVLLDNSVRTRINRFGLDSVFMPEHRGPFLEADICMINLEMPFSHRGAPVPDKQWTFRGTPEHISLLLDMNIHIVSLANNHTLDYGVDAFLDTLEILEENNIRYVGGGRDIEEAKRWETFEVSGKTIAFLAANRVIPTVDWYATHTRPGHLGTYDPAILNEQIALAKEEADFVFVYVHWGVERNVYPENWQRNMAYGYIDAGADAVVGAHPHVLQGFEFYNGKLIAYSLGNFIFTDTNRDTAALELSLEEDGEITARLYPYIIMERATLTLDDPERLEKLRAHLNEISFGVVVDEDFNLIEE